MYVYVLVLRAAKVRKRKEMAGKTTIPRREGVVWGKERIFTSHY